MSTLQIRNVPPALMDKVKRIAARERRSINSQVLVLLGEATDETERGAGVAELLQGAAAIRKAAGCGKRANSLALIHQARRERLK